MSNYNGVINELIKGEWTNPEDQKKYGIPIKKIEIGKTLDGLEKDLIKSLHLDQRLLIVSDPSQDDEKNVFFKKYQRKSKC